MMWGRARKVQNGQQNVSYEDTTMGMRRIAAGAPEVAAIPVDLDMSIDEVAWFTGIDQACPDPSRAQGFREASSCPAAATSWF